ncbi:YsnF/AvaK domain-containing protein [Massilia horti]|uniref:DUF2382 domain-containing protein n=1 Tax=Massilia horti TaxID=2562153 RepID=A0A4Y9T4K3_9BURK|nr:YsnF/AvaK domain-containing protein [Massilia horti]TFW35365.1 DUF2382 domain-containing protein [Massilia horti]
MQHILIAVFEDRSDAERAQDELLASGFNKQDVKISKADATGQTDSVTGRPIIERAEPPEPEGFTGNIRHMFQGLFGTDTSPHAQKYTDAVGRGHHVLTVTTADEPEVERAADIVEKHGPVDIDEKVEQWAREAPATHPESMRMSGAGGMQQSAPLSSQSDLTKGAGTQTMESLARQEATSYQPQQAGAATGASLQGAAATSGSLQRDTSVSGTTAIPVIEERLKVGKREVQRGGVRVYSRVVETPVTENIGLREEHVNVERHQVDQPLGADASTAFREQQIEVRETAEEPVVEKTARVVEEVTVGKQVTERQQEIHDTLRHTEVQIERLGGALLEDEYRQDWTRNYSGAGGNYDEYAPAYRYGAEMAGSDQYRGRSWNDIENDVKNGWITRQGPGAAPTWERFKAAARHGWERMRSESDLNDIYRSHWNSNYAPAGGSYDEYAPAYRYGYEMARNDKYKGLSWNQVENELRHNWEARNAGGPSTWDRFKDAIRLGWDRVSS